MAQPKSSNPQRSPAAHAFARVVVGLRLERRFDYRIPSEMAASVRPGCRVVVPFGHRDITGYVLSLQ